MQIAIGQWSSPFDLWRPGDGCVFCRFAFSLATTDVNEERPDLTPAYVIGAACDDRRGFFVSRDDALPFLQAHWGAEVAMHDAAFGLRVVDALLKPTLDIYEAVEGDRVTDSMILHRLHALATVGHTARNESQLADCARIHLGIDLERVRTDVSGGNVRSSFGSFLDIGPSVLPASQLTQLGQDTMVIWNLSEALHRLIREVLSNSYGVWGFVNRAPDRLWGGFSDEWLRDVIQRFGLLTHHIQLRASVLTDALMSNGVGVAQDRREQKANAIRAILEPCKARMRDRGFLMDDLGNPEAMQTILDRFHHENPDVELKRTESGEQWATTDEELAKLADHDAIFGDCAALRRAQKALSTFLDKMDTARIHPRFGFLLETGRTYCSGFALQNLPNEADLLGEDPAAPTIRGCLVPAAGSVFIDCDLAQIELVVLGYALRHQFGLNSRLAQLVNDNHDVHRLSQCRLALQFQRPSVERWLRCSARRRSL